MSHSSTKRPTSVRRDVLRHIAVALTLLMGLAVITRMALQSSEIEPDVAMSPECADFGEIWETNAFLWPVKLQNISSRPVQILDFGASCRCVSIAPRKQLLHPGETATFRLILDLRSAATDAQNARPFAATIVPRFAYGVHPRGGWEITGKIRQVGTLTPPEIRLRDCLIRSRRPERATASFVARVPIQAIVATCDPAVATVQVKQNAEHPETYEISVLPRMDMKAGHFKSDVMVRATLPSGEQPPPLLLPISGVIKEDIWSTPECIRLGVATVGTTVDARILIRSATDEAFDLKHLEIPAGSALELLPESTEREQRLRLTQAIHQTGDQQLRSWSKINVPKFH